MTATPAHRQPAGTPVGGRFAQHTRAEAAVSLTGAKTAAERAIDAAYLAGIAEGERRAAGAQPRDRDGTVLDLSGYDLSAAPTQPMPNDPWSTSQTAADDAPDDEVAEVTSTDGSRGPQVECLRCCGDRTVHDWGDRTGRTSKVCPDCNGSGAHDPTPPGLDTVVVPYLGRFERRRDGVSAGTPSYIRMEASRPLTDDEVQRTAQLLGYGYRSAIRGEPLGDPVRDSDRSFIVFADMTKSRSDDLSIALDDFEDALPDLLTEGSPLRRTDRSGPGTKGTRLVEGHRDPGLRFETYYDDVITSN